MAAVGCNYTKPNVSQGFLKTPLSLFSVYDKVLETDCEQWETT